jgi:hypothetical protein
MQHQRRRTIRHTKKQREHGQSAAMIMFHTFCGIQHALMAGCTHSRKPHSSINRFYTIVLERIDYYCDQYSAILQKEEGERDSGVVLQASSYDNEK